MIDEKSIFIKIIKDRSNFQEVMGFLRSLNNHAIATFLNEKISGEIFEGQSLAYKLVSTEEGRVFLAENDGALAKKIDPETFPINKMVKRGPFAGQTVAYALAHTEYGRLILAANGGALAKKINPETFQINETIKRGPFAGQILAYSLALTKVGCSILTAKDCALAKEINPTLFPINEKMKQGPFKGKTLAYSLALTKDGCVILAANDCALAKEINSLMFPINEVIEESGAFTGSYSLFLNKEGGVTSVIDRGDPERLIINQGFFESCSYTVQLAYILASTKNGCAVLAANNYALAKIITSKALNRRINDNDLDYSVAFKLASTEEGRAILAFDNCALAKKIDPETLNRKAGAKGRTIALELASTEDGRAILEACKFDSENAAVVLLASSSLGFTANPRKRKKSPVSFFEENKEYESKKPRF